MHGGEATGGVIDVLSESRRLLICIDFFDVARTSTSASGEVTNITPSAVRQFFPSFEPAFILGARCHRAIRLACAWRATNLKITGSVARDAQASVRDACATRATTFRLAAETDRLAACAPQSLHSVECRDTRAHRFLYPKKPRRRMISATCGG